MFDILTATSLIGFKKLSLLLIGIGMTAGKAGLMSIDMLKIWGPFLATITAAVFMGGLFEQVQNFQIDAKGSHKQLAEKFETELAHLKKINEEKWHFREYKINKAFDGINEGGRWTLPEEIKANEKINASISENSREDNVRHAVLEDAILALSKRMTRIFERMDKIEGIQ